MEKRNRIIYWIATGLLSAMMIMGAGMYIVNYEEVSQEFTRLGYNTRIVIPLAILKLLGVVAILTNKSKVLREWAYFGFLIDFLLAAEAHLAAGDGEHTSAFAALAFWLVSYIYGKRVFKD